MTLIILMLRTKRITGVSLIQLCIALCLSCLLTPSFAQQTMTIQFRNTIGNEVLQLGETYKTSLGEDVIINRCKYYISKISLVDSVAKYYGFPDNYYLIDEADSTTKTITITTSANRINDIQFLVGVDSIKNVSGVQDGALDPMYGMFWTWNTGYVMAKIEGTSSAAKVPGNLFSYHVGGFKTGESALRFVRLNIGENIKTNHLKIVIEADINKWFQSVHNVKIAEHPICHSPSSLAMQIADNYATMFKIVSVN